jgi:hypothetical protein
MWVLRVTDYSCGEESMPERRLKVAALDEGTLSDIQKLKSRLGKPVVAYAPACRFAELSDDELEDIQQLESRTGLVLLAYDCET